MGRWRKLGIIAGAGALPVRIAASCRRRGEVCHVVALAGMADGDFGDTPVTECAIGEAGKMLRILRDADCDAVVLAGIVKRPDFASLRVDWRGAVLVPKLVAAGRKGDGALLTVLVDNFESEGFTVVGADEVSGDLVASAGALGDIAPDEKQRRDIEKAEAIVRAIGPFDVGQGAVVAEGVVIAIEAAEGTDRMLERCVALGAAGGVLVKRPKPGQERRVDLPTIGTQTVQRAHAAGLSGVAVEAGGALIIDADETRAEANRLGLFVYAFEPTGADPSKTTA